MKRLFAVIATILSLSVPARAAVTLDACGTQRISNPSVNNFGYVIGDTPTVSASAALVLIFAVVNGGPITAPTAVWDLATTNQSMTLLGSANNGSNAQVFIFGLRNPTTGSKQLNINWTTNGEIALIACSWLGADLTSDATAFKNFNSASGSTTSSQSVTISSAATGAVMAAHTGVGTSYASVNQTSLFIDNTGNTYAAAANRVTSAVNPTMTANFSGTFTTVSAGISIAAAGGGGGPTCGARALTGVGC